LRSSNGRSATSRTNSLQDVIGSDGFFGIRLESIGGLGAHLAGQLLAEAAVLVQGLNGAHFSSYGSEKKGSPVKSYVRFCDANQELRTSSPIDRPNVVAVFHEALAKDPSVTAGVGPTSTVIVNSTASPDEVRRRLGLNTGSVGTVDALGIAVEEGSRVNTAMIGAVVAACGFIDPEAVRTTIRATFERKYPHLVEANIRTFDRAFAELRLESFAGRASSAEAIPVKAPAAAYGYLEAPIGGTIVNPGNTILKDLTASRQGFIPIFDRATCVDCGLCDLVCPDFCLVWEEEQEPSGGMFIRLRGIDYRYCKGCLKCIDACPTLALTEAREEEGYAEAHSVPLYPSIEGVTPRPTIPAGEKS
jgi:pyruvate ferredoxin oxidoreductase gamma subunit